MVKLDRIYTKSGDKGKTSLGNGQRVMKSDPRMEAIGTVDELNAYLGVVAFALKDKPKEHDLLEKIQNDLFDVGADLCMPDAKTIQITNDYVVRLEGAIDTYNADLAPLKSFVLPGGSLAAAHFHVARTICRRAERALAHMMALDQPFNPEVLCYINRLSDLLFVLARFANQGQDILWEPQKWQEH